METTHTPGPWVAISEVNKLGYTIEQAQGVKKVAIIPTAKYGLDNLETVASANARLIAAAPDLLAACQEFVRKVEVGEARSTRSYNQMKEAIKKATE